ncbi:unnamed protein product, partial [Prorocentrum cordatum]
GAGVSATVDQVNAKRFGRSREQFFLGSLSIAAVVRGRFAVRVALYALRRRPISTTLLGFTCYIFYGRMGKPWSFVTNSMKTAASKRQIVIEGERDCHAPIKSYVHDKLSGVAAAVYHDKPDKGDDLLTVVPPADKVVC